MFEPIKKCLLDLMLDLLLTFSKAYRNTINSSHCNKFTIEVKGDM